MSSDMMTPYQPPPLPTHVIDRVINDVLDYVSDLDFNPSDPAAVQTYLVEVTARVDIILAPYSDHAALINVGEIIKRGARSFAFEAADHLFHRGDGRSALTGGGLS